MQTVANALADPVGRSFYLVACLLLLVAPMIALALWYRSGIARTPGGDAVLKEQARIGVRTPRSWQAVRFGRDIAAGRYGNEARRLQNAVYGFVGVWLVINALAFGLLIWADEVNRP